MLSGGLSAGHSRQKKDRPVGQTFVEDENGENRV